MLRAPYGVGVRDSKNVLCCLVIADAPTVGLSLFVCGYEFTGSIAPEMRYTLNL